MTCNNVVRPVPDNVLNEVLLPCADEVLLLCPCAGAKMPIGVPKVLLPCSANSVLRCRQCLTACPRLQLRCCCCAALTTCPRAPIGCCNKRGTCPDCPT